MLNALLTITLLSLLLKEAADFFAERGIGRIRTLARFVQENW